jgi:hypothetical protein
MTLRWMLFRDICLYRRTLFVYDPFFYSPFHVWVSRVISRFMIKILHLCIFSPYVSLNYEASRYGGFSCIRSHFMCFMQMFFSCAMTFSNKWCRNLMWLCVNLRIKTSKQETQTQHGPWRSWILAFQVSAMFLLPEVFHSVRDNVLVTAMGVFADWSQCNLNRISGTPQAMGATPPQQDVFRHSGLCKSSSAVGDTIQLSHMDRKGKASWRCPFQYIYVYWFVE